MNAGRSKGVTTLDVKDKNSTTVLLALKKRESSTARVIAQDTSLSSVTVNGILKELMGKGWVKEGEMSPSRGGRPSRIYEYNRLHRLGLLVITREIKGIDTLCLRVIDMYGAVIQSINHGNSVITASFIEQCIEEMISGHPQIAAIAMGIPGIEQKGTIVAMDYKELVGFPVVERLYERFTLPVIVENDVNASVMGILEEDDFDKTLLYIYFPQKYPPGAGICVNGRLLKGGRHFAGEVGWLPLNISWGQELWERECDLTKAAAEVIQSLTAVLDPDRIVLYGELIDRDRLQNIEKEVGEAFSDRTSPLMELSDNFNADFESGLSSLLIGTMEKEL